MNNFYNTLNTNHFINADSNYDDGLKSYLQSRACNNYPLNSMIYLSNTIDFMNTKKYNYCDADTYTPTI